MFRFFENLVDPYVVYEEKDAPPQRLLPFLMEYSRPFRGVFMVTAALKCVSAALDVALIWYVGRMVDLLSQGAPADVMKTHGTEFAIAALVVLFVRPIVSGIDVALLHNTILVNYGALFRWRAIRHVLRQSVGWFENDFAGRIANRLMQTPPAAGDAVFQVFDAVAFALTTLVGAVILLGNADSRLMVPLLIWAALYLALMRWTVRRAGPASMASSDARSSVTGRVVDSFTNIHSVKMFAHDDREIAYVGESIENLRATFAREMRIITRMDVVLTMLNGALIVSATALATYLWYRGQATVGTVAAASALVLRLNSMTYWIMWAMTNLVQSLGVVAEGMETIAQPIGLVDGPAACPLEFREGRIETEGLSHHYGRGFGGSTG